MAADYVDQPRPRLRNAVEIVLDLHQPYTAWATFETDVTEPLARMSELRRNHRVLISPHAYIAHCLALAVVRHPALNTFQHGDRLVTFNSVDIGTTVERRLPDGTPIAGSALIRGAEALSLAALNATMRELAKAPIGTGAEARMRVALARRPWPVRKLFSWRARHNPHLLRRHAGTVGLTTVRMPDEGSVFFVLPPNPYTLTVGIGGIADRITPQSAGGRPRKILCGSMAVNHAVVDGMRVARFGRAFRELLEGSTGLGDDLVAPARVAA